MKELYGLALLQIINYQKRINFRYCKSSLGIRIFLRTNIKIWADAQAVFSRKLPTETRKLLKHPPATQSLQLLALERLHNVRAVAFGRYSQPWSQDHTIGDIKVV